MLGPHRVGGPALARGPGPVAWYRGAAASAALAETGVSLRPVMHRVYRSMPTLWGYFETDR
jgi:hypothetical protein